MFIMKTTILCIKNNVHHEDNYTLYKEQCSSWRQLYFAWRTMFIMKTTIFVWRTMFIMKTTIHCMKNNVHHEDNYTLYEEQCSSWDNYTLYKEQCSSWRQLYFVHHEEQCSIMKTTILCIKNNVHHEDNYTLYKEQCSSWRQLYFV